jgi:Arginase/agmatinase/formimionoglutamate hydrolase, arginase family
MIAVDTTNIPVEAEILVQKLPCDMGIHRTGRKGTLKAPEVLLEDAELESRVHVSEVFPDEFDLEETHRRIQRHTREMLGYDTPLLSVGGDHSVSYPVLKAVKQHQPDLSLVWLDAHLDAKRPVDERTSHDVVVRRLVEEGVFKPRDIFCIGTTRIDEDEKDLSSKLNVYRPADIPEAADAVNGPVYVSFDIDAVDVSGTGYPDGELSLGECRELVRQLDVRHADLVEAAPPLDRDVVASGEEALSYLSRALAESY